MSSKKINVCTVNYTDEDRETLLKNMFVEMLIKRDHPEVLQQAEKLAKKFMKQNEPTNQTTK